MRKMRMDGVGGRVSSLVTFDIFHKDHFFPIEKQISLAPGKYLIAALSQCGIILLSPRLSQ